MTERPERLIRFYESPILYVFLIASFFVSGATLYAMFVKDQASFPASTVQSEPETEEYDFIVCLIHTGPSSVDVLNGVAASLAVLLVFPSIFVAFALVFTTINFIPEIAFAPPELLFSISFVFVNAYYWVTIAFIIDSIHDAHLANAGDRSKLTIVSIDH